MNPDNYVHGYTDREMVRLNDQSRTLTDLLHHDTRYPAGSKVLEMGCGVGAQTVILARNSPEAEITSVDISPDSVAAARAVAEREGITNVTFQVANIFELPFVPGSFDHVFICFVLEHLPRPERALDVAVSMLRPGGSITVIEGDHGSTFFYPLNPLSQRAIDCLVDLQSRSGGDALIGRRLFPLLTEAGLQTTLLAKDPQRPNLVARLKGSGDAPALVLQGHVDVVTTANQKWTHPPFEGKVIDGWLWGRGALYMKGDVTMMLDILLTNRAEVLKAVGAYQAQLQGLADLLQAGDEEGLCARLTTIRQTRIEMFP